MSRIFSNIFGYLIRDKILISDEILIEIHKKWIALCKILKNADILMELYQIADFNDFVVQKSHFLKSKNVWTSYGESWFSLVRNISKTEIFWSGIDISI